jgi:hypothetical protein
MAIPTFASTPENENAPAMTSGDQQFMGLTQLSEEDLFTIIGNVITSGVLNNDTDQCTNEMMKKREKERLELYKRLYTERYNKMRIKVSTIYWGVITAMGIASGGIGGEIGAILFVVLSELGISESIDGILQLISPENPWNGNINDIIIDAITTYLCQ